MQTHPQTASAHLALIQSKCYRIKKKYHIVHVGCRWQALTRSAAAVVLQDLPHEVRDSSAKGESEHCDTKAEVPKFSIVGVYLANEANLTASDKWRATNRSCSTRVLR